MATIHVCFYTTNTYFVSVSKPGREGVVCMTLTGRMMAQFPRPVVWPVGALS